MSLMNGKMCRKWAHFALPFKAQGGGEKAAAPPIDSMHLKTSENYACKCIIFA